VRENDHREVESRRACPELVERGRLNLAQDAVLGWHLPLKSPVGTTEKAIETWSWIRGADPEFSIAKYSRWKCRGIASG
jgi:hypothetical protein